MLSSKSQPKDQEVSNPALPEKAYVSFKNNQMILSIPGQKDLFVARAPFAWGAVSKAFLVGGTLQTAPYILKYAKSEEHHQLLKKIHAVLDPYLQSKIKKIKITQSGKTFPAFLEVNGGEQLYGYFTRYVKSEGLTLTKLLTHYKLIVNLVMIKLDEFHKHGLAHGDFKPDNVLIKFNFLKKWYELTIIDY